MGLLNFLNACGNKVPNNASHPRDANLTNQVAKPLRFHDKNSGAYALQMYERNYKRLYKKLPKSWRPYLEEMASNAVGQEILANLPPDIEIDLVRASTLNGAGASYDPKSNTLSLAPIKNGKTGTGGKYNPYMCLVHESRHAMQDHLGLMLGDKNSSSDVVMNSLLMEADAFAVGNTEQVILNAFGTSCPSKEAIASFMKRDLIKEGLAKNPGASTKALQQQPEFILQQALRGSQGSLAQARLKIRQRVFNSYWAGKGPYLDRVSYELQGLRLALMDIEEGKADLKSDPALMKKIKTQIAQAHGLSLSELEQSSKVTPALKRSLNFIEKNRHLDTQTLKKGVEQIYLNTTSSMLRARAVRGN